MPSQQQCRLDQLPLAWQRQFALSLPKHLKLTLRQCSRQLQQLLDGTGVCLIISHTSCEVAAALQLARQHLASLDITHVASAADGQLWMHAGLLSLATLKCTIHQHGLLVAIAGSSPRLRHLKLCCVRDLTAEEQASWSVLHQQVPGQMLSTLRCLELDKPCHKQFTQTTSMWPFVGCLTNLDSLIMHMDKPRGYGITRCELNEQCWQAAVQPLVGLTRLEMGTRTISSSSASDHHYQQQQEQHGLQQQRQGLQPAGLTHLQHLKCFGFDQDGEESWNLSWVAAHSKLTCLDLLFCSAGEVDFEVIVQLKQLCSLTLHCYPDEFLTSSQLAPLSGCCELTCLRLDSLVVEPGHVPTGACAATTGSSGQAASSSSAVALPQLRSLRKLVGGILCKAPLSTLAPNLTQLRDLDCDLGELELSANFLDDQPPAGHEALAGLEGLQLLAVNIHCLVRHAAYASLASLSSLCELHIDMVGNLSNTHLGAGGLPQLPGLTKLVMTLAMRVTHNLEKTYTTEEDVLLWQNQASLRHMRLRGSKLLGGFLVHDHLLALLPEKLPQLQCIELVKCGDLNVFQLGKLVGSRAVPHIVVQGCRNISDRDCSVAQEGAGGAVTVEYLM